MCPDNVRSVAFASTVVNALYAYLSPGGFDILVEAIDIDHCCFIFLKEIIVVVVVVRNLGQVRR